MTWKGRLLTGVVLGTAACGGKHVQMQPGTEVERDADGGQGRSDETTNEFETDAEADGPNPDAGQGASTSGGEDNTSTGAGATSGELATTVAPTDVPTTDVPTTDVPTTDVPSTEPIAIEPVSFVEGECPDNSWCWVTPAPIGEHFTAISGSADGNTVFAVGDQGACVQYDASARTWTIHRATDRGDLHDVEVLSPTQVWVAGADGLDFYDGTKWERQLTGWTTAIVRGVGGELWTINSDQLYALEDGTWQRIVPSIDGAPVFPETGGVVQVVPGDAAGEFWALTFQFKSRPYMGLEVVHFENGTFSKLEGEFAESYWPELVRFQGGIYFADSVLWYDVEQGWQQVEALPERWLSVGETTFMVSGTTLTHSPSVLETKALEVPGSTAFWGADPENLWLTLTGGGIARINYVNGEVTDPTSPTDLPWLTTTGIEWSASETDAWRGPELEHFDGTSWTKVATDEGIPYVGRISGSSSDNVWFTGTIVSGLWHWDGSMLRSVPSSSPDVRVTGVHAFDADTVWSGEVGESSATLQRFEGGSWSTVKTWSLEESQFPNYVVEIAGASAVDAYVALRDHVEHFNGETWETVFSAPETELLTAMAVEGERMWVLGEDHVYHRDANGDWQTQWYAFQSMSWLGLADGAVWMMGGWATSGVLRFVE